MDEPKLDHPGCDGRCEEGLAQSYLVGDEDTRQWSFDWFARQNPSDGSVKPSHLVPVESNRLEHRAVSLGEEFDVVVIPCSVTGDMAKLVVESMQETVLGEAHGRAHLSVGLISLYVDAKVPALLLFVVVVVQGKRAEVFSSVDTVELLK